MGNLGYAILIVVFLVLGVGGIITGYIIRIMGYPYGSTILGLSTVLFILAVLLPLILPNKKGKEESDEDILDRGM